MELYRLIVEKVQKLIEGYKIKHLDSSSSWCENEKNTFLFQNEISNIIGDTSFDSTYLIAYLDDKDFKGENEILLIGPDIKELDEKSPFARITFIYTKNTNEKSNQALYRTFRDIEYTRYKVHPSGVSIKTNTNELREVIKVSKVAKEKGISFKDIGAIFQKAYLKNEGVTGVCQIFITDKNFDYNSLAKVSALSEGITTTLDNIFKNLKMDCSTCNFKGICDEIEGMRDIHKREEYKI